MKIVIVILAVLASLPVHVQRLSAGGKAASLQDQAACDEQAHKRADEEQTATSLVTYSSHFDPAINVCYVLIASRSADARTQRRFVVTEVFDAFERKNYAGMFMTYGVGAPDNPTSCYVVPRGGVSFKCKTEVEFRRLVDKYFGL